MDQEHATESEKSTGEERLILMFEMTCFSFGAFGSKQCLLVKLKEKFDFGQFWTPMRSHVPLYFNICHLTKWVRGAETHSFFGSGSLWN